MTSNSRKKQFFDSDIVYELESSDIYFLSSLFSFLVAARPNYGIEHNESRLTYIYWAGYFSALSDNIDSNSHSKFKIQLYNGDYLFLRSVAYDEFIDNWVSGEEEKIETIFGELEKIYNSQV